MPRLGAAFFCSGFAALLCQIVWQRMLGIFAGSDTVSAALVVGAFLAGLGLGSILGAYGADRLPPARALVGFALCEAGVALCALVSKPFLYDWLALSMAGRVDAPLAVFALCFAGLAVPTTLMGASLPLLSRAVATSLDTVAERVGRLYGLNTLGAGLGALLGGWLVLGNLGYEAALRFAAALELGAAALALTLLPGLRRRAAAAVPVPRAAAAPGPAAEAPFGGLPLWCGLVFLSGYVVVALEVVWVRLLGQVGQFHAYRFPTVLGVFLLADGLGMAAGARMVRGMDDPRPAFFAAQGAGFVLAAALIGALWLALPHPPLASLMGVDHSRFSALAMGTAAGLALLVVGPPAFLIGMTFPFAQRAVQRDLASVGARVGWAQLANIAGNAAGSLGTGLLTLHLLGTTGTMRLLAALTLALLLGGWLWGAGRRRAAAAAAALALGCVLARRCCRATTPSGGACTPCRRGAGRAAASPRGPRTARASPSTGKRRGRTGRGRAPSSSWGSRRARCRSWKATCCSACSARCCTRRRNGCWRSASAAAARHGAPWCPRGRGNCGRWSWSGRCWTPCGRSPALGRGARSRRCSPTRACGSSAATAAAPWPAATKRGT
jgi:hypothetical protein